MGLYHAIGYSGDKRHIVANCGIEIYANPDDTFEFYGRKLQYFPVQTFIAEEITKLVASKNWPVPERIAINSGLIFHWEVDHREVDQVLHTLADLFDSEDFAERLDRSWSRRGEVSW